MTRRPTRSAAARSAEKVKLLLSYSEYGGLDDGTAALSSSDNDSSEPISSNASPSINDSSGTDEEEIRSWIKNRSDCDAHPERDCLHDGYGHASLDDVDDASDTGIALKNEYRNRRRIKCVRRKKEKHRAATLYWEHWEEKNIQNDSSMEDAEHSRKQTMQMMEPSPEIMIPLLPFQKEWLWWSLKQEQSDVRGGILADEMGMGKTIQAISLILTSQSQMGVQSGFPASPSSNSGISSMEKRQIKGTLVICPVVAVIHWKDEVIRFTRDGSLKVLIYHGTKRLKNVNELAKADIVLTTYSIVESEYRNTMLTDKLRCKWCRKLFESNRLGVHQRYYCGPHAQKTEKQAKQAKKKYLKSNHSYTLDLIEDFTNTKSKNASSGGRHKSKIREIDLNLALSISNETLYVDDSCKSNEKGFSALHAVKWNRIILDEAHCIKDRKCSTAKSVFALSSNFRWALSGTPLQNRVGELYSLVRFLEIEPFSYYYCKLCDCKSLDYGFRGGRKCDQCDHSALSHFCWWNKYIANPIKRFGYMGEGCNAMMMLKQKLLGNVLLRRTKLERAADLALPPTSKYLRKDRFDAKEDDFYQALYTQSQSQFNTYIDSGTLMNNYAHIFDLLTRLRQAVDHPYLVVYSRTRQEASIQYADAGPSNDEVCSICRDQFEEPYVTDCNHTFCKSCIMEYVSTAVQKPPCPTCQKPLTIDFTSRKASTSTKHDIIESRGIKSTSILKRIDLMKFQTSTKIEALREEIAEMLEKDCTAKAIVFSQFTSFLELINFRLQKFGVKCVKLDGSMSLLARDQMIDKFTNDPDCKVFLMSLKAGGVALNLTVASHVFLMDPWWNPAVEQQAQDRIHRLGQYKPIRVVRFVIENTIEERILKLQEKKQLVFEGTVGGSSEALGKLTENDLRFLFTS